MGGTLGVDTRKKKKKRKMYDDYENLSLSDVELADSELVKSLEKLHTESEKCFAALTDGITTKEQDVNKINNLLQKEGYVMQLTPSRKVNNVMQWKTVSYKANSFKEKKIDVAEKGQYKGIIEGNIKE